MKKITAEYNGKEYTMSVSGWKRFLEDKPICDHLTRTTIDYRLKQHEKGKMTVEQALGIAEYDTGEEKRKVRSLVSDRERPVFDMFSRFNRMRLV